MEAEIKPADVYVMVQWNFWLISILCFLVVVQILVKVALDSRFLRGMKRTENLLTAIEAHGEMNDAQKARMARVLTLIEAGSKAMNEQAVKTAARVLAGTVKAAKAVEEIPDKTAEKVVERIKKADSDQKPVNGGSGINLGGQS